MSYADKSETKGYNTTQATKTPSLSDDFNDGVIDNSLWDIGGAERGFGWPNAGVYSWSHQEVPATDGYLEMRIRGPATGNTYGAEAWIETKHDFNDGQNHKIGFTWGSRVNASHIDFYAVELTDGEIAQTGNYAWFVNDTTRTKNIFFTSDVGNNAPTQWSISIDAQKKIAELYKNSSWSGTPESSKSLDPNNKWYLRFIHADATSSGYPGTDNSLFLYNFSDNAPIIDNPGNIPGQKIKGYYVLDGYGNIFNVGNLKPIQGPYFGWDIARKLEAFEDAKGNIRGCVLDGFGGIHPIGNVRNFQGPKFGWDIARDIEMIRE